MGFRGVPEGVRGWCVLVDIVALVGLAAPPAMLPWPWRPDVLTVGVLCLPRWRLPWTWGCYWLLELVGHASAPATLSDVPLRCELVGDCVLRHLTGPEAPTCALCSRTVFEARHAVAPGGSLVEMLASLFLRGVEVVGGRQLGDSDLPPRGKIRGTTAILCRNMLRADLSAGMVPTGFFYMVDAAAAEQFDGTAHVARGSVGVFAPLRTWRAQCEAARVELEPQPNARYLEGASCV
jgi:hypothetical protein